MNSSSAHGLFGPRAVMGAAIVGLLGAAGMFLVEQIYNERRRVLLAQDLARLDQQVATMREELQNLKEIQQQRMQQKKQRSTQNSKRHKPLKRSPSKPEDGELLVARTVTDTDAYTTDYNSALGTDYDVSSEEFYDVSTDSDTLEASEGREKRKNSKENGEQKSEQKNGTKKDTFAAVDSLMVRGSELDVQQAYHLLEDLRKKGDVTTATEVLWRLARCCQRMSNVCEKDGDIESKKMCVTKGIAFCEEAVELDPNSPEAHKWLAIMVGLRSDFVGTKDKIKDGSLFKHHLDEALKLNPEDPSLYHLMGRFKFELSELSWLERRVASTLFSDVPMATYEEALSDFLKAEELCSTDWKENRLLLAKCYIGQKDYKNAVQWLDSVASVANRTSDDEIAEREAQVLLNKYSTYRAG